MSRKSETTLAPEDLATLRDLSTALIDAERQRDRAKIAYKKAKENVEEKTSKLRAAVWELTEPNLFNGQNKEEESV